MEGKGKIKGAAAMDHIAASLVSPKLQYLLDPSSALFAEKRRLLHHLRRLLPIALRLILRLIVLLLSPVLALLASLPPPRFPSPAPSAVPDTASARALARVLSLVSRVPVASRKYELVRSLAERILDDNVRFSCGLEALNRAALGDAFSRTLRNLEAAMAAAKGCGAGDRSLDLIVGVLRSGLRRWSVSAAAVGDGGVAAEKLAAELLWMAQKMEACGAVSEAVARWGDAAELARLALSAEPRLQVALVRLSVFLFKHANEENDEGEGEGDEECLITRRGMSMLTSWLPLLCRASNGADAPILSSRERAETVRGLEGMIQKLSWEQQEEVLALWLHHFALSPDSDWPNLESCYTRWYAESRKLLLK